MKFGINEILRVCATQIFGLLLVLALRSKTVSIIVLLGSSGERLAAAYH